MRAEGTASVPELMTSLLDQAERVVVGQRENIELVLLAVLCGGHVLLEGVPGTAKTLMARTLARLLAGGCKRGPVTPGPMAPESPGAQVFHPPSTKFRGRPCPGFTDHPPPARAHPT